MKRKREFTLEEFNNSKKRCQRPSLTDITNCRQIPQADVLNEKKKCGKRQFEKTQTETISEDLKKKCCPSKCLQKIPTNAVFSIRKQFWKLVITQQNQEIAIHRGQVCAEQCVLAGILVCSECWRIVHGVSRSRYIEQKYAKNPSADRRIGMKYGHERVSHLSNFLSSLGDKQGEQMPDRAKIMLPTCMTQKSAYKEYVDDHETPFSYRHFQRVWKERCPDMKASERSAFTECKECSMFKQLKLSKLTKEQMVKLQQQKKAHLLMARIAREKYYKHSKKAADRPDKYLSIIIDNMDQAKTNLPRFPTYHKGDATLTRVHHHVTGVLEHGQKKPYLFTWTDKFPCDANITINCLLKVLEDVSTDMSLPPTLYIQADNSAKDNKNVILMGFLASLVQQRIVKKIKLSFLMVGHTHEDVDQLFSRVSVHISRTPIQTLPVLQELSREAYSPTPHVEHLENIWDYRQLGLSSSVHLVGHSTPHVFKFAREGDQVLMSYKEWPLKSSPYKKIDVSGLANAFQEDPEAKTQMSEKGGRVFQAMEVDLQKWEDGGKLSSSDVEWWRQHLARERQFPAPSTKKASEFLHYSMGEEGPAVPLPAMQGLETHIRNLRRESMVKVVNRRSRD